MTGSAVPWVPWTGPRPEDLELGEGDVLRGPVPGERWPYALPDDHEIGCHLHAGGCYCDCAASANDDDDPRDPVARHLAEAGGSRGG